MKVTTLFLVFCVAVSTESRNYRTVLRQPVKIETKPSPRIINGHNAIPHSIPFQALLDIRGSRGLWTCSGSIISKNYILTSGRCVEGAVQVHVTLGVHNSFQNESTQVKMEPESILMHPDYLYDSGIRVLGDIALLKMEAQIPFDDYIQPVALPSQSDLDDQETFVGSTARASGWGYTDMTSERYSDVLNYYDSIVIKNSECRSTFYNLYTSNLCTLGDGGDSRICSGDIGGPLVVDNVQIGISSFWMILCIDGYPTGFTRVSSYMDWIVANSDVVMA